MVSGDKGGLHLIGYLHDEHDRGVALDSCFQLFHNFLSHFSSGWHSAEDEIVGYRVLAGLHPYDVGSKGVHASQPSYLLKGNLEEGGASGGCDGHHVGRARELEDGLGVWAGGLLGDGHMTHLLLTKQLAQLR